MRHTAKHELFAQYLADGMNQADAYIKAGFKPKDSNNAAAGASRLVKTKPSIVKRRDEIIAKRQALTDEAVSRADVSLIQAFALSRDDFLRKMYSIYEKGTAAEPVLDSKGIPIGEYRTNLAAAKGALESLGQEMHGMFIAKSQSIPANPLAQLTDEQVREIVAQHEKENADKPLGTGTTGRSAPVLPTTH